jgi:cell division protein FtsQ
MPRRDPAPSRWSYRMQRWMLTPGIRAALRIGVPTVLFAGIVALVLLDDTRREAMSGFVAEMQDSIRERPEFMVRMMAIDGAGPDVAEGVRAALALDFPVSSFDLDLEALRETILALDPVRAASVRIRPGGVLQVDLAERVPAVVWRTRDGLTLLDRTGARVTTIEARTDRADLPLIAGDGADREVAAALRLVASAGPLTDRVRGVVRVGERRWDIVLDRGQRILLPVEEPVRALERVIALSEAQEMLERDLAMVDMRIGARPTLRLTEDAVGEWRRIQEYTASGQDG